MHIKIENSETFANFEQISNYFGKICDGVIKITPPDNWSGFKENYNDSLGEIPVRIMQLAFTANENKKHYLKFERKTCEFLKDDRYASYSKLNEETKVRLKYYKSYTDANTVNEVDLDRLEITYRETITETNTPIVYAADNVSLFSSNCISWNLNKLPSLISGMSDQYAGLHSPFTYFGSFGSTFVWHVQDMDLNSINYHHFGAPKIWYYIPRDQTEKFENVLINYGQSYKEYPAPLRHKMGTLSLDYLKENKVQYKRIVQHPGQFIITYNHVYHSGWNAGFNANETVNYGFKGWLDNYDKIKVCGCEPNHGVAFKKEAGIYLKNLNRDTIMSELDETAFVIIPDDEPTSIRTNEWNEYVLKSITNAANTQDKSSQAKKKHRADKPSTTVSLKHNLNLLDTTDFEKKADEQDSQRKRFPTRNDEPHVQNCQSFLNQTKQYLDEKYKNVDVNSLTINNDGYNILAYCSQRKVADVNCKGSWKVSWNRTSNIGLEEQFISIMDNKPCEH